MGKTTYFRQQAFTLFLLLGLWGTILSAAPAAAVSPQQDGDKVVIGTYRTLRSDILDEDRLLLIHLPEDYEQTGLSYPVLYLLYGRDVDNYFAHAVMISEKLGGTGEMPPMIIVGVANTNRYRDNLPVSIRGREDSGGAAKYLQFFEKELFSFIEQKYRTKPFRILAGPQAGAVFSLYSLITRPDLFHAVISENPFMNPENAAYLFPLAKEFFQKTPSLRRSLYIECENNERPTDLEYAHKLEDLLHSSTPENFRFRIDFREPSGYFIPPLPFPEGFRMIFEGHKLPEDFVTNSVQDLIDYYENTSKKLGFQVDAPDLILMLEGDKLNRRGKTKEAIAVFEYQLTLYPKSLNAFWQLGEIHRNLGMPEKARDYYKRFLAIRSRDVAMVYSRLEQVEKMIAGSAAFRMEKEIRSNGIKSGLKVFKDIRSDPENKLYFDESEFNGLGYRLMTGGRIEEALRVFELNVEMYPGSANAYDSLAEAWMKNGNKKKALRFYKKSLELNPDNQNAAKIIEELTKK